MGLGKTVVAIALIVANPPPPHLRMLPRDTFTHLRKLHSIIRRMYHLRVVPFPQTLQNFLTQTLHDFLAR